MAMAEPPKSGNFPLMLGCALVAGGSAIFGLVSVLQHNALANEFGETGLLLAVFGAIIIAASTVMKAEV